MKAFLAAVLCTLFSLPLAAQTASEPAIETSTLPVSAPIPQPPPLEGRVLFILCPDDKFCAFMMNPTGHAEVIPIDLTQKALANGYVGITVGSVLTAFQEVQKQKAAIESDYNLLVQRYNRLAAINAAPPVVYSAPPQPTVQDQRRDAIRMFLQMQNSNRPQNFNVNVRDCSRFPALCVN
jgi:hypothetical protein